MGFEDRVLNKMLLEEAGGNMYAALESLMQANEWDTMLADLEEMVRVAEC